MSQELYWIIPLCLILGIFFRRQIGWILFGILILIYLGGKHFFKVVTWPFLLLWRIATFPFYLVYSLTSGYTGTGYAMETQWKRDKSIFFAKFFVVTVMYSVLVKVALLFFVK